MDRIRFLGRTASCFSASARLCELIVFRRVEIGTRERIDPEKVVVQLLYAINVLVYNYRRLTLTLIGDDTSQMHDAVSDDDVETERAPILFLQRRDHPVADVVVISGRIGDIACKTCHRLQ